MIYRENSTAKVIVTLDGRIQQEVVLAKSRMTVGRRPGNDLILDHLTVSGQHAAIDTAPSGSFILDLGSTNGTLVNGQPITKHLLQDDDVIDIGKYKLKIKIESLKHSALNAVQIVAPTVKKTDVAAPAIIKVLNGSNVGREIVLNKAVTTMGTPGAIVITLSREANSYRIKCLEGSALYKINDGAVSAVSTLLIHGDVISLGGTRMSFHFPKTG